jgi:hypothetical protein
MSRRPTPEELMAVLRDHADQLHDRLGVEKAQFRIPTDGRGLRVQVCVSGREEVHLPSSVDLELEIGTLRIPIEVVDEYEDFEPLEEA